MLKKTLAAVGAAAMTVAMIGAPAYAYTPTGTMYGTVQHVSSNNIKIRDQATGQTMSFLMTPHFNSVFTKDGKTAQMKFLRNGTRVEVLYDQHMLGTRHADKIIVLDRLPRR
ncbi:MAG: hypothetical protein ACRENA_09905 [Vulcanimicrobiaceae bacterium]